MDEAKFYQISKEHNDELLKFYRKARDNIERIKDACNNYENFQSSAFDLHSALQKLVYDNRKIDDVTAFFDLIVFNLAAMSFSYTDFISVEANLSNLLRSWSFISNEESFEMTYRMSFLFSSLLIHMDLQRYHRSIIQFHLSTMDEMVKFWQRVTPSIAHPLHHQGSSFQFIQSILTGTTL